MHPDDDPEHKALERERLWESAGAQAALKVTLVLLTFISGHMCFEGVLAERERDMGLSFEAVTHAVLVAAAVTVTLFVGWHIILSLTPRMRRWYLRFAAYLFAIIFTAWALAVSTWYNFVGLSGHASLILYMSEAVDNMTETVDAVTAQASQARAVIPALQSVAASTCASYDAEVTQGLGTGSKGVGKYSQALLAVCTATRTSAESLDATSSQIEQRAAGLGTALQALSSAVNDRAVPVLDREAAFRKGQSDVETLLRSVRNARLRETAEAALAALKSSVPNMPDDGGTFGAKQRALLDALRGQVSGAITALETVLAGMPDGTAAASRRPERVTLTDVSLRYILRSIPNLALAVGIDLFPLIMMAFLELAGAGKRRRRQESKFNGFLDLDPTIPDALLKSAAQPAKDRKGKDRG